MLVAQLGATHVSVGENFRFGNRAKGDPELLSADDRFETRVVRLVEVDDEIVSSTHVRGLVLAGDAIAHRLAVENRPGIANRHDRVTPRRRPLANLSDHFVGGHLWT